MWQWFLAPAGGPAGGRAGWGVFRHAVSEAEKLGVNVFPAIVYADFETAIHNAVTTVWPGCEVKACRFHLGQSWWLKYNLWDSASTMEGRLWRQFLNKIFGLSLLPPAEVSDRFALEFISNLSNYKRLEQFCDYLLESDIDANATFPLPVWSECSSSSLRTIKACESLHAHFNTLFYSVYHNIFVLVSALQKIQNKTYIKMRSVTRGRLKKIIYSQKKWTSFPQKLNGIVLTWFQESHLFHQCPINFYQTPTCISLLLHLRCHLPLL